MKRSEVLSLLLCYNFEREFKNFSDKFVIKIDEKEFPNEIFWFINDKCFIDYNLKTNDLWCRYYDFWEYFKTKFNFNDKQIRYLIKFIVEKHFKLNGVTPLFIFLKSFNYVEKHFKLNGVTPYGFLSAILLHVEKHFKLNGVTPSKFNFNNIQVVEKHFKLNEVIPIKFIYPPNPQAEEHFTNLQ